MKIYLEQSSESASNYEDISCETNYVENRDTMYIEDGLYTVDFYDDNYEKNGIQGKLRFTLDELHMLLDEVIRARPLFDYNEY